MYVPYKYLRHEKIIHCLSEIKLNQCPVFYLAVLLGDSEMVCCQVFPEPSGLIDVLPPPSQEPLSVISELWEDTRGSTRSSSLWIVY